MQKSKHQLLAFFAIVCVAAAYGQAHGPMFDPGTKSLCEAVKNLEPPAQDRPSPEEMKSLAKCYSRDLYFGVGQAPDPVMARKCAFVEISQGATESDIRGRAVLMMVYANGRGAERNLDLAIKLACEMKVMPQDVAGSVHQLDRYRQSHWAGNNFSVCDHSSAKVLYGQCAILDDYFDRLDREKQLNAIVAGWKAADQHAFQPLREAAEKFFKARASKEINLISTFEVQELAFHERDFIEKLQKLERGELPAFTAADLRAAEADLNRKLEKLHKTKTGNGTVTPEGILATQPLWQAYEDAWVKFGAKRYPKVTLTNWKGWLTQERVAMLDRSLPMLERTVPGN